MKKSKKCKECDSEFLPYKSTDKYCSYSCFNKNRKPNLKLTKIRPVSKKRQKENTKYLKLRAEFLQKPENRFCPITGEVATDIHHKKGRIGSLLCDTKYWVALSRKGHDFVENNPEWAYENGYSIRRNQTT